MSASVDSLRPLYYFTQTLVYNLHVHLSIENRRKTEKYRMKSVWKDIILIRKAKIIHNKTVSVIMNMSKVLFWNET